MSDLDDANLLDIALALHRAEDAGLVCEIAVHLLDERGISPVCLLLASDGALRVRAHAGEVPDPEAIVEVDGPLFQRLKTGVPISSADNRAGVLARLGATMAYPLEGRRHLVGLLTAAVDPAEHPSITRLVPHLGTAVDNASLRVQARREVRAQALEDGERLAEITRRFDLAASLPALLERILSRCAEAAGAEKASLMLLDEASDQLVLKVVQGLPDKAMEERINRGEVECTRFGRGQGVAGRVLESGVAVLVRDTGADQRFTARDGAYAKALLCLPLVQEGSVIGVLNLSCTAAPDDLNQSPLLKGLADAAAAAIERTRLYEAAVVDRATGLHVGALVESILESEARRSDRYGNHLGVVLCQLGDPGDGVEPEELGAVLRRTMRAHVDLAGHLGRRRFMLVLPETRLNGAAVLCRRLGEELSFLRGIRGTHAFAAAERKPGQATGPLLARLHQALEQLGGRGPGLHMAAIKT